tara:strand:- start:3334 stop:3543 length:210 start_codon:yes stop_codon:yes gene_type:complete
MDKSMKAILIAALKAAEADRAKLFKRGEWTRAEMERANNAILRCMAQLADLREAGPTLMEQFKAGLLGD